MIRQESGDISVLVCMMNWFGIGVYAHTRYTIRSVHQCPPHSYERRLVFQVCLPSSHVPLTDVHRYGR